MTKMKNTKKGMAKKALSISLVAAMLATSNVPVWAAFEADDATPIVVEAPVAEAPVAETPQADTFAQDPQTEVVEQAGIEAQAVVDDEIWSNVTEAAIGQTITFKTNVGVTEDIPKVVIELYRDGEMIQSFERNKNEAADPDEFNVKNTINYTVTAEDIGHTLTAKVGTGEPVQWSTPVATVNVPYNFEQLNFLIDNKIVTSTTDNQVNIPYEQIVDNKLTINGIDKDIVGVGGNTTGELALIKNVDYTIELLGEADAEGNQVAQITFENKYKFNNSTSYQFNVTDVKGHLDNTLASIKKADDKEWNGVWGTKIKANLDTDYDKILGYEWQKCDTKEEISNLANWKVVGGNDGAVNNEFFTPSSNLLKYGNFVDEGSNYFIRVKVLYEIGNEQKVTYSAPVAIQPKAIDETNIFVQLGVGATVKDQVEKATVIVIDGDDFYYMPAGSYTIDGFNESYIGTQTISYNLVSPYVGSKKIDVDTNRVSIAGAKVTLKTSDYVYSPDGIVPEVESVVLGNKTLELNKDYVVHKIIHDVTAQEANSEVVGAPNGAVIAIEGINEYTGFVNGVTYDYSTCKVLNENAVVNNFTADEKVNILPENFAESCEIKMKSTSRKAGDLITADNFDDYFTVYYKQANGTLEELPTAYVKANFTITDTAPKAQAGMTTSVVVAGKASSVKWAAGQNFYNRITVNVDVVADTNIFDDTTKVPGSDITRGAAFLSEIAKAITGDVYMVNGQTLTRVPEFYVGVKDELEPTPGNGVTYTGSEMTFDNLNTLKHYTAADGGSNDGYEILRAGHDYDVIYNNNVNAGDQNSKPAPSITIRMKGKYTGERTFYFQIQQKDITDIGDGNSQIHNTTVIGFNPLVTDAASAKSIYKPLDAFTLVYKGKTLSPNKDYTGLWATWVTDEDIPAGGYFVYSLKAHTSRNANTGKEFEDGNYTGEIEIDENNYQGNPLKVKISAKSLKSSDISIADIASQEWTGKAVTPELTITDLNGKYTLKKDVDYTVEWKDNVSTGTATAIITGIDNRYTGKVAKTFTITSTSLEDGKIVKNRKTGTSLDVYLASDYVLQNQLYADGKAVKAVFNVVDASNNLLVEGRDYTVTYKNNINVGTATITVTGKGSYEGTLTSTFNIVGQLINGKFDKTVIADQVYTGEEIKPEVSFTPSPAKLVEGQDYEITYVNNVDCFTATGKEDLDAADYPGPYVVARGIGNYAGQIRLAFNIKKAELSNANVTAEDAVYAGGKIAESKITVKNPVSGKELEENKDYTVEYVSGVNAGERGTAVITLIDTDNYTIKGGEANTLTVNYKIVAKDLKDVDIQEIADQFVTGEQIKPTVVAMNGSVKMVESLDYEVSYGENVQVGEGTATIKALAENKNYTGEQTVKFNIVKDGIDVPEITASSDPSVDRNIINVAVTNSEEDTTYDYVLCTSEAALDSLTFFKQKNNAADSTQFQFVRKGTYYVYARAAVRDENGKLTYSRWSEPQVVTISTDTPNAPTVTNVTTSGNTVTVTYMTGARTEGVDVILGTAVRKQLEDDALRPVNYNSKTGLIKNVPVTTKTVTFTNVAKGTYYVGVHPYITSADGLKYFGRWSKQSALTTITVK